jgi:hypothetical protein
MAFQIFLGVFASISDTCFNRFIFLQTHVAKIFYLHVSKVDRVMYMLHVTHLPQPPTAADGRRICV